MNGQIETDVELKPKRDLMISNNHNSAGTHIYYHTLSKYNVGMTFKVRTTTHFFHTALFSIITLPTFVEKVVHGFHENIT